MIYLTVIYSYFLLFHRTFSTESDPTPNPYSYDGQSPIKPSSAQQLRFRYLSRVGKHVSYDSLVFCLSCCGYSMFIQIWKWDFLMQRKRLVTNTSRRWAFFVLNVCCTDTLSHNSRRLLPHLQVTHLRYLDSSLFGFRIMHTPTYKFKVNIGKLKKN